VPRRYGSSSCKPRRQKEVVRIDTSTAILIVAIFAATFAFTTLVLKIVEIARSK
jgi:hypothetical protein